MFSSLTACTLSGADNAANAIVDIGSSTKFSEKEIKSAVDAAIEKFHHFEDCDLIRIWYDEEQSNSLIEGELNYGNGLVFGATKENAIILLSDFYAGPAAINGGFNPDHTYRNWKWILTRENPNSSCEVSSWGYG